MIILIHDNELQLEDFEKDFLIMAVLEKQMIIETDVRAIEIITKNKINFNNLFINDAVAGHRGKSACIKTLDKEFISNIFSNYEIIAINEYIPYDENIEITNKRIRYKMREVFRYIDIVRQEFYDNKRIIYYKHGVRVLQSNDMINWTPIVDTIEYKNYFNGIYKWE